MSFPVLVNNSNFFIHISIHFWITAVVLSVFCINSSEVVQGRTVSLQFAHSTTKAKLWLFKIHLEFFHIM